MTIPDVIKNLRSLNESLPEFLDRGNVITPEKSPAILGIINEGANPIRELISILDSSDIKQQIQDGKLTIGMIKPRLDIHMKGSTEISFAEDARLLKQLMGQIKEPLEPVVSVSFYMSEEMLETFYAGDPKNRMLGVRTEDGNTKWDDFKSMMSTGPVTFFLLHSKFGNAVDEWRNQMGESWNIDLVSKGKLRKNAKTNNNNLTHGSDSPESVYKELEFIKKYLLTLSY